MDERKINTLEENLLGLNEMIRGTVGGDYAKGDILMSDIWAQVKQLKLEWLGMKSEITLCHAKLNVQGEK